jgi:hypothetical protein
MAGCTFEPNKKRRSKSVIKHSKDKLVTRLYPTKREKEIKEMHHRNMSVTKEKKEVASCTFKPDIKKS